MAQSRAGLTATIAAGPSHGFGGDYDTRGGVAGLASLAGSVWTTPSLALTLGVEASFTAILGAGDETCVGAGCGSTFPSVSGVALELGWIAGRPGSAALFSGALGIGRLAADGATGLGLHLQAGVTLPFASTWAVSIEGRGTRTPRRVSRHLIVGALLVGLRWHPRRY